MIQKLQHRERAVAEKIRSIFQASYKVEAELLKATDFPPLKRPLEKFVSSTTQFFGHYKEGELAGVIEIEHADEFTDINSLVVHPQFFRQGIGRALMEFTFTTFQSPLYVVETGLENGPATTLYKQLGFKEVKQWDTDHGVRKVKFELRKLS